MNNDDQSWKMQIRLQIISSFQTEKQEKCFFVYEEENITWKRRHKKDEPSQNGGWVSYKMFKNDEVQRILWELSCCTEIIVFGFMWFAISRQNNNKSYWFYCHLTLKPNQSPFKQFISDATISSTPKSNFDVIIHTWRWQEFVELNPKIKPSLSVS